MFRIIATIGEILSQVIFFYSVQKSRFHAVKLILKIRYCRGIISTWKVSLLKQDRMAALESQKIYTWFKLVICTGISTHTGRFISLVLWK